MSSLKINFENCYGIKKLVYDEFDFSICHTFVIYAPNGVMKTSFAKVFRDISKGGAPCDQMDDTLTSTYECLVDSSNQIDADKICVIEPFNPEAFDFENKILSLLANDDIKDEYLSIYKEIELLKRTILSSLKKISGSGNYEAEIVESFSSLKKKNIYEIFDAILDDIKGSNDSFAFRYNDVFDKGNKVRDFLHDNFSLIKQYIEKYDELISRSDFFSKQSGYIFGTTEAKNLGKSLEGDEYFSAGHKLTLKSRGEISNKDEFLEIINNEIEKVFNDDGLKQIFEKIERLLFANKELQAFKKVIEKNNYILLRLNDYDDFRCEVWLSFLKQIVSGIESLVDLYNQKKNRIEEIIQRAKDERSIWEDVTEEFNNRFVNMPFKIEIKNKSDAILNEDTPSVDFEFRGKAIERKTLVDKILSQGEKRALYLLNIIFEIKNRQLYSKETLFIVDDIADSFDYKNKYAIIEYLNDLNKVSNFYSIVLTHNFDFYRTVANRLRLPRENRLHAIRAVDEIKVIQEVYQNNPFETWRKNMKHGQYYDKHYTDTDAKKHIIALIPFVRNLIEYGRDITDPIPESDYNKLTSLVHSKPDTKTITFGDLKLLYKTYLDKDDFDASIDDASFIYDTIIYLANNIGGEELNLENKIILSMAIRHKAEEYMLSKVKNKAPINGSQTGELFGRYKDESAGNLTLISTVKTLESVNIMTPENIHINSFMYEPILDMGIDELMDLYKKVCNL